MDNCTELFPNLLPPCDLKNSFYDCSKCSKTFDSTVKLKRHTRRSHAEKVHVCNDCGKSFSLPDKLKIHSLSHAQFAEFLCSICGKCFKRRDKLREHIIGIHSTAKKKISLTIKPPPPRIKRYRFPKMTAEEMAKFEYKCTICVVGFHRRGILVNHMTRLHPEVTLNSLPQLTQPVLRPQRSFKCHYCDRVYLSNGKRKSHMKSYHDRANCNRFMGVQELGKVEILPRSCIYCPRQFLTNAKLLQHQRKVHSSEFVKVEN